MHPRGFPKSGVSHIPPWPGYLDIPISRNTSREGLPFPQLQRTAATSFDTSMLSSVSPLKDENSPVPPPKGSPNTTLQIPSTGTRRSAECQWETTERSALRHLSSVEYPGAHRMSESWATRCTKPRTPRTTRSPPAHRQSADSSPYPRSRPTPHKSPFRHTGSEKEPASNLGIVDVSGQPNFQNTLPRNPGEEDSSLNIAQRIEDRLWHYSIHGNVFKKWLLETVSLSISAICMVLIVAVLIYLKDRPLNKWPLESSGVTIVATLSRISSAALLLPVYEALGQLKWSWFFEDQSKKIWDFEIFDNASRGPWGSFQLLIRTKARKLAAFGAAIVLFALALDPFFQQLLDFQERWTLLKDKCTIPRVSRFESNIPTIFVGGVEASTMDHRLGLIAESFFFNNGTQPVASANGSRTDFPFSCPTSKCTWPVYETLGTCSACEDVSHLLEFACMRTEVDWVANTNSSGSVVDMEYPSSQVCGYFLNISSEHPILMSGYVLDPDTELPGEVLTMRALPLTNLTKLPLYGDGSINFKNYRNTIFDALFVTAADGPSSVYRNETPFAQECVLTWCVKTIESKYEMGRYTEHISRTFINTTKGPFPWISNPVTVDGYDTVTIDYVEDINLDVTDYPLDPEATPRSIGGYGASRTTAFNTMTMFDSVLPSFITVVDNSSREVMRFDLLVDGPATTRDMLINPWGFPGNVPFLSERLAHALTDAIRSFGRQELIEGYAFTEETYVVVRWAWLTLPVCLLLFTTVFLVLTINRTAKERDNVGVWKTSAVATLLYGFPDDMQKKIASDTSCQNMRRAKAKKMKARLVPKMGWRVSGTGLASRTSQTNPYQGPPGWL